MNTMNPQIKKILAEFRKKEADRNRARRKRGECCAVLCHGPGHQSKSYCQKKGPHKIHEAVYGCYDQRATWKGMKKFTGFFDEAPEVND